MQLLSVSAAISWFHVAASQVFQVSFSMNN